MFKPIPLALCLAAALATTAAPRAGADDGKAACVDAASKGQSLRDAHQLVEAREQFRACAAATCPSVVQSDCAGWLSEVEKLLPTIVLSAKDGGGHDLIEVTVTMDGRPLATALDGEARPVDPGVHTFHFESKNGAAVTQQVLVKEGQKAQSVAVVLAPPAPTAPPTTAPPPAPPSVAPAAPSPSPSGNGGSSLRTVGWILGGVGALGVVVGGVSGLVAVLEKGSANCDDHNFCDAGPLQSARTAAVVSDVGLIGGAVLLGAGAAILVVTSGGSRERGVAVAPMVSPAGGGVRVGGTF